MPRKQYVIQKYCFSLLIFKNSRGLAHKSSFWIKKAPLRATPHVASVSNLLILDLSRSERVRHEHRDRHRTHTTGNRCNESRDFLRFLKVDIAHESLKWLTRLLADHLRAIGIELRNTVDAHINDRCAGFDPIAAHHFSATDRRDDDIRLTQNRGNIFRA